MIKNFSPAKVLLVASEAAPIAKVGGLGDVIGALPKALAELNIDVRVVVPLHGLIDRKKYRLKLLKKGITVSTAAALEKVNLWQTFLPGSRVIVYLIEHPFFANKDIYASRYQGKLRIYPKDLIDIEKYFFFCHAVLQCLKSIDFQPDIFHLNDWMTAPVSIFLKTVYRDDSFFKRSRILYTIHSLANQGIADPKIIDINRIKPAFAGLEIDIRDGDLNLMAEGIANADLINTVSPTYAKEIITHDEGAGLDNILKKRKKDLFGILNAIDTDFYNPAADKLIAKNYSRETLENKSINKLALQKKQGWPRDKKSALAGVVTRLTWQKGIDLMDDSFISSFLTERSGASNPVKAGDEASKDDARGRNGSKRLPCQFIFLGTGEKEYETRLKRLAKKYPEQVSVQLKFDEKLAHEIYAASDIFLVPSRFEPCGLTQMIAMRYGSVPVVRRTGGLADTVKDFRFSNRLKAGRRQADLNIPRPPADSTGLTFEKFSAVALRQATAKALAVYYNYPDVWRRLMVNGMKKDFSWSKSAKDYLKLYKRMIGK